MRGRRRIDQPLIGLWFKLVGGRDRQIRLSVNSEKRIRPACGEVIDSTLTRKASSEI
jgi:hypothetical protein